MTDPIRQLQAGAEQIGAGAFDYRIPVISNDELGDLARRFNAMAERLQASYETLEARVRERTARLAQANEDKTRFFAAANHDLRQPLNALGLFIARLRNEHDPVRRSQSMDKVEAALHRSGVRASHMHARSRVASYSGRGHRHRDDAATARQGL